MHIFSIIFTDHNLTNEVKAFFLSSFYINIPAERPMGPASLLDHDPSSKFNHAVLLIRWEVLPSIILKKWIISKPAASAHVSGERILQMAAVVLREISR